MKSMFKFTKNLIPAPAKRIASFLFKKEVAINRKLYNATSHMPLVTRFVAGGFMTAIVNPWLVVLLWMTMEVPVLSHICMGTYFLLLAGHIFPALPVFVENAVNEGGINVHPVKAVKNIFAGLATKTKAFIEELTAAAKGE